MPNYNYECSKCDHTFQEFQGMSEKVLLLCPKCKKKSLVRLISGGSGVVFKGTGFYETDYKKKSSPETKSNATESKAPETTKSDPAPSKSEEK